MKNKIVVLIGAGGCGKTSIAKKLMETNKYQYSPTTTSRKMRDGEKHGVDYFFVSENEFKSMIENGDFLEYILFNENYYGTNKNNILNILENKHCVLCIDGVGAKKVKKFFPKQAVTIFIYVPEKELAKRMKLRGDSADHIKKRIKLAKEENAKKHEFDFIIENKNGALEKAVQDVIEIVEKNRK